MASTSSVMRSMCSTVSCGVYAALKAVARFGGEVEAA
jgi:hypothetical protein